MPKVCPIAIVRGCRRCPIFKQCPVKSLIGDYQGSPAAEKPIEVKPKSKGS